MTIAIDVRRLRSEDAPACDAVIASLPYHFGLDSGRQECAEAVRRQDGLAAVSGGDVVGFLTWRPWYRSSREITWMAVHAERRGAGIGRALVERLAAGSAGHARYVVVTTLSEASPEPGSTTAAPARACSTSATASSRSGSRRAGGTPRTRPSS